MRIRTYVCVVCVCSTFVRMCQLLSGQVPDAARPPRRAVNITLLVTEKIALGKQVRDHRVAREDARVTTPTAHSPLTSRREIFPRGRGTPPPPPTPPTSLIDTYVFELRDSTARFGYLRTYVRILYHS